MATLFDSASLALIPSGVKESKVYSIKPTDGSGDFTFSRGTDTATRVNASGLIEKERSNQLVQSNSFDTSWGVGGTLVGGQADKDGGTSAWSFTSSTGTSGLNQNIIRSGVQTFSAYVKKNATNGVRVYVFSSLNASPFFNLNTGSVVSLGGAIDASIEAYNSEWWRISVTFSGTTSSIYFYVTDNASNQVVGTITLQDAQLESGLVATDYIETTTAAVYEGITDNLPRLDYSGGASCPSLLLEPSRTNLIDHSEYFGAWNASVLGVSSVVSNYAISPEGVQNAAKVNFIVQGDSDIGLTKSHPVTGGSTYAYSIYIKGEGSDIGKDIVVKSKRSGGDPAGTTTTQTLTGEWQRVDFTTTYAANNTTATFYLSSNDATSVLVYGAQAELGNYATSIIPTYGTAASRAADDYCDLTSMQSNGITTSGAYSLFFDISNEDDGLSDDDNSIILALANTSETIITIRKYYSTEGQLRFYSNKDVQTISYADTSNKKWCMVVDDTEIKIYSDGALKYTGNLPSSHNGLNALLLQCGSSERTTTNFSSVLVFPTALTSSEAIALTA
jgi:hypothetical protein